MAVELTQEYLKSILHYNPETGIFTWIKTTSNRVKVGDKAGVKEHWGYISISINCVKYKAHRLAFFYMENRWPEVLLDHKDRVRDNNIWGNLREASHSENAQNGSKQKNASSKYRGVNWDDNRSKWYACIRVDGKTKSLGRHATEEEAHIAYRKAADKYHGEFANYD